MVNPRYHFDGSILEIVDPELDLSIYDKSSQEIAPTRITDGDLVTEVFYSGGLLHGPARVFGRRNCLLSEAWFCRGVRMGKSLKYHLDGTLAAHERWREDRYDGLQEYFYPDKSMKSQLPYRNGLLHGEVRLYHPDGRPRRICNYADGKRNGIDVLWYVNGQMEIEAQYAAGISVGTLRHWYSNGTLAEEVNYHSPGHYDIRKWDKDGLLRGKGSI